MESYLRDRNYLALYLNAICVQFASALMLSFIGAHLLLQGLPLYLVLLYFGLEFFARALFTPLGSLLTRRFGPKKAILISNGILVLYFVALGMYATAPAIGFASFLLYALSRGIYHPVKHYLQAVFINNHTRGHFLTMEIVLTTICASLAVGFATYSVTVWHSFMPVAALAAVFLTAASLAILRLLGDLPHVATGSLRHVFKRFFAQEFRRDFQAFVGFSWPMAFNNVVVALLVYFVVESLQLFGVIMISVLMAQMIFTLIYGLFTDKNRIRSNKLASGLSIGGHLAFLLASTPLLVAGIKAVYDTLWNSFDSSFTARFHEKIKHKGLVYACMKEMSIGIGAASFCFLLATVAWLWQAGTFTVAIGVACLGIIIAWKQFKD